VTLTRNQIVVIMLIVVAACAVGAAIYYVENVFEKRETDADLIKQGRTEELVGKPAPKPPAPPPLERSTSRGTEVVTVRRAPAGQKVATIRGNGEFVRLPALPGETGPVVTGLLDRAKVDEILRSIAAPPPEAAGPDFSVTASPKGEPSSPAKLWSRKGAAFILELTGRSQNGGAVPERARLVTAPVDADPDAAPWPFELNPAEKFEKGGLLTPESDRARHRAGLLALAPGARFASKGRTWRVVEIDLIP
jgi:hypothetical protein